MGSKSSINHRLSAFIIFTPHIVELYILPDMCSSTYQALNSLSSSGGRGGYQHDTLLVGTCISKYDKYICRSQYADESRGPENM